MTAPLVDLLERVLAEHPANRNEIGIVKKCGCGEILTGIRAHRAHVAAEQARVFGEWLTSDEVYVAAACAPWTPRDAEPRLAVALAAVRDYGLGVER